MKSISILFLMMLFVVMNTSCNGQTDKSANTNKTAMTSSISVYYFHYTHRCVTCMSVENVSKKTVKDLYGNNVSFASYNLEETEGKAKGKELGVSGQTLLIVSGDTKIDLTNEGFLNARSNPEKLKQIIKEKIDPLL
jgi:hypothetical protein